MFLPTRNLPRKVTVASHPQRVHPGDNGELMSASHKRCTCGDVLHRGGGRYPLGLWPYPLSASHKRYTCGDVLHMSWDQKDAGCSLRRQSLGHEGRGLLSPTAFAGTRRTRAALSDGNRWVMTDVGCSLRRHPLGREGRGLLSPAAIAGT